MTIDSQSPHCLLTPSGRVLRTRPAALTAVGRLDEQRIWRTVCAALVLLLVCGGVACGAERATIPAGDEASGLTWTQVWGIIVGITAVDGVASVGGVAIGKRMRVSVEPQPLEIKSHPDYATKQDLRRLEERQSSFEKDMRDLMRDAEGKTHRADALESAREKIMAHKAKKKGYILGLSCSMLRLFFYVLVVYPSRLRASDHALSD